ncbi:helix-turn-helix transcriptional regulator [Chitinophaga agrisoli]|uniref:Helix-turn-helix transcriptional regulator n=1 Tax=Chitinophaga agrisoli TaxID=2607653 RepID=A0A5B2VP90_9BACT|nr:AraC family transcriptional regulator [Chitinophaga agrisoli]KAA2240875.1 helix-turn-helix transcriptional regulator [Chitinophaga agrisoli]
MDILPKGAPIELPLPLTPCVANWATACYQQYDFGYLLTQSFLNRYYQIYLQRFIAERPAHCFLHCPHGTVVLQFTLQGPITGAISGHGEIELLTGQYSCFYLPAGIHTFRMHAGEYECLYIALDASLLEELAASRDEIKKLLVCLHTASEHGACLSLRQMDYRVQDVIAEMRACKETGANLLMELRTNISTLLNLYRKSLNAAEHFKHLRSTAYTPTMISIQEEVSQNPSIQKHTLSYFARKHNMSQSTLKRYFKDIFEKTLHEYVWEECMKKAVWMRSNPAMSIEDIADEVGYADKSGFLKSFKQFRLRAAGQGL